MNGDFTDKLVKISIVVFVVLLPLFFLSRTSIDGTFDSTFLAWGWNLQIADKVFDIFSKVILVPIIVSGTIVFLDLINRFWE